jgi:hypothetical protein
MGCEVTRHVIICGSPNVRMMHHEWLKAALQRVAENEIECASVMAGEASASLPIAAPKSNLHNGLPAAPETT